MSVAKEVAALRKQTTGELRARYAELFGETTTSGHKDWLIKRIAWRMQAKETGDLSERARKRATELANDADLRLYEPRSAAARPRGAPVTMRAIAAPRDERIPPVGSFIRRTYKGTTINVEVLANSFGYEGQEYPTLTAVARAVSGTHCNGFAFFRLGGDR